jgi:hypothetical protein
MCQVGSLAIVIDLEERGTSFDLGLYHARWSDLKAALFDVGLAESAEDGCSNFHDRAGLVAAQDEMTIVQKCLLGCAFLDGLLVTCRNADDGEIVHM